MLEHDEVEKVARAIEAHSQLNVLPDWPVTSLGRRQGHPLDMVEGIECVSPDAVGVRKLTWGFHVSWQSGVVYNTRIESMLAGKGMWRQAAETGRCIVPVAAYFEPHDVQRAIDPKTGRETKRSFMFWMSDGTPVLLAAVADDDECSIVTTEPWGCLKTIHRRMPLVLKPDEVGAWLGGDYGAFANSAGVSLTVRPEDELPGSERAVDLQESLF